MKSYEEIKEILLRDYPKYFDILDLDMQIRGLFGVKQENYKEQLDKNLDNYMDCSKIVANNEGLRDHEWLKQEYERLLNIYNDIKNTYKEADNMNLYKGIKSNLNEAYDVSHTMRGDIDEVSKWSVEDFIADGRYSYAEKIKYIAEQLNESANVDVYDDESWNECLAKIARILYNAANEIKNVEIEITNPVITGK